MDPWIDVMQCTACQRPLTHEEIDQWPVSMQDHWEKTGQCALCESGTSDNG